MCWAERNIGAKNSLVFWKKWHSGRSDRLGAKYLGNFSGSIGEKKRETTINSKKFNDESLENRDGFLWISFGKRPRFFVVNALVDVLNLFPEVIKGKVKFIAIHKLVKS